MKVISNRVFVNYLLNLYPVLSMNIGRPLMAILKLGLKLLLLKVNFSYPSIAFFLSPKIIFTMPSSFETDELKHALKSV